MRTIVFLFFALTTATVFGQFDFDSAPRKPDVTELQAKLESLRSENAQLREIIGGLEAKLKRFEDANKPTLAAKVTMVSKDNCSRCPIADAYHSPRYAAMGWIWDHRSDGKFGRPGFSYPYYEVCIGDRCYPPIQCGIYELDARVRELLSPTKSFKPIKSAR